MVHITFNGSVAGQLNLMRVQGDNIASVFTLFLPLEVGNIANPENSKINEILYEVISEKGAYSKFIESVHFENYKISRFSEDEEICFWVDFNDVRQHLCFAYFLKMFDKFKNKFFVEYDFNAFCENRKVLSIFEKNKKPLSASMIFLLKTSLSVVQQQKDFVFRTVLNKRLISVRDDYFDKYIFEFLDEKPKNCMKLIGEIFTKFGRLSVSFDQIIIRMWMLLRDGVIERINEKTEHGLFFEYKYKLSDHIDMQRDS